MANNNKVNPDTGLFMSRKEMELQLKLMTESRNFWKAKYFETKKAKYFETKRERFNYY